MFKNKQQVDEHVKKLLSISKDPNDKIKQYNIIAKWYVDVGDYETAKYYLDKYIKFQNTNKSVWALKGTVHMELNEYDKALEAFDSLFMLSKNKVNADKIIKVLEKMPQNEQKIKFWLNTFEAHGFTSSANDLKSMLTSVDFHITEKEFNDMKSKVKNGTRELEEFLGILSNKTCLYNPLEECIKIITTIPITEFSSIRKIVEIFKNHFLDDKKDYIYFYITFMMKLLNFRAKINENQYQDLLNEFLRLVLLSNNDYFRREFVFYVTTFGHYKMNYQQNSDFDCLIMGYNACYNWDDVDSIELPDELINFLNYSKIQRLSISGHILEQSNRVLCQDWFEKICNIVWSNNNCIDSDKITSFRQLNQTDLQLELLSIDLQTLTKDRSDLSLLLFQMYDHLRDLELLLNSNSCKIINHVIFNTFQSIPSRLNREKHSLVVSKLDIVTFLIGSLITYHKILETRSSQEKINLPIEMFNDGQLGSLSKWWFALYDFVLMKKRFTMVGLLREMLKKGLDFMHLQDGAMSSNMKLCLGHFLEVYANKIEDNKTGVLSEACMFYESYFNDQKSLQVSIPSLNSRHRSSILQMSSNSSVFKSHSSLFDCINIDKWKKNWTIKAYKLLLNDEIYLKDGISVELYEECIDNVSPEIMDTPELYYYQTKLGFKKIKAIQSRRTPCSKYGDLNNLIYDTKVLAEKGTERIYYGTKPESDSDLRFKFEEIIKELDNITNRDVSVLDYSTLDDISNNNQNRTFDEEFIPTSSSVLALASTHIDPKLDGTMIFQSDVNIDNIVKKAVNQIKQEFKSIIGDTDFNLSLLRSLEQDVQQQNELYSSLVFKNQNLMSKFGRVDYLESRCTELEKENQYLIKRIKQTEYQLFSFHQRLLELEKYKYEQEVIEMTRSALEASMNNFENHCNLRLNQTHAMVASLQNQQLQQKIQNKIINNDDENDGDDDYETSIEIPDIKQVPINMSKFSAGKWQCSTCVAYNDNSINECQCCRTKKPILSNESKKEDKIDMSRFSAGKWQCPTCVAYNDNNINDCQCCQTKKPILSNESKKEDKIDMSKFSAGKWQCPTCVAYNDNNLHECLCCKTKNPSSIHNITATSVKNENVVKFGQSSLFIKQNINSQSSGFNLGNKTQENVHPILFGGQQNITKSDTTSYFSMKIFSDDSNLTSDKTSWKCSECTTENKEINQKCIACNKSKDDNGNSDNDSDVIITQDLYVTDEQIAEARALGLPDHFYHYKNKSNYKENDDNNSDCDSNGDPVDNKDEVKNKIKIPFIEFNFKKETSLGDINLHSTSNNSTDIIGFDFKFNPIDISTEQNNSVEDGDADDVEPDNDHDPQFEPIVTLEKVNLITGEEDYDLVFEKRSKLYQLRDGEWKERCLGDIRVLKPKPDIKDIDFGLLVMRQNVTAVLRCNQKIDVNIPKFIELPNTNNDNLKYATWIGVDFSKREVEKVKLMIRFKTSKDCDDFKESVKSVQKLFMKSDK